MLTSSASEGQSGPTSGSPRVVVVDASIAVKWVVTEPDSDRATELLRAWIADDARLVVPPHFFVECAAVLNKRVRRNELRREDALALFLTLQATEVVIYGDPLLSHQALAAAGRYQLGSVHDAHYIALAELYGAQFWTADDRLCNALGGRAPFVHRLGDFQPAGA
jgi:predicted nucleic acid-binding protein